eukprot:CAMPEP_0178992706 /NCGR_PEP_ID=MMETSP0795-20121207/6268_1 /TAXON_ID=88552 /ORGANISM="Amoebophrya sp., Strain Ameob2" /LENGTH=64 /DNA_ID=CAMNT_0020684627 /DNA_START=398 /DNA_END=589 /DNA_ORIENTATION=+
MANFRLLLDAPSTAGAFVVVAVVSAPAFAPTGAATQQAAAVHSTPSQSTSAAVAFSTCSAPQRE